MKKTSTGSLRCCIFKPSRCWLSILLFPLLSVTLTAQQEDTLVMKSAKQRFLPSPPRAALYSLIPGGGQIYNRRYWKAPIVYAGMGGLYFLSLDNRKRYTSFKTAYELALQGKEHAYSSLNLPPSVLRNARDEARKSLEESYIFLGLIYLAQIAEAYVDAHLQDFDISDDLSFRLRPGAQSTPWGQAPGLSIAISLDKRRSLPILP
jgi:hypothetical protein